MNPYDIAILGGDRRIACMAPIFLEEGCRVTCYGTREVTETKSTPVNAASLKDALDTSGTVICGIPFEKNGYLYCEDRLSLSVSELQRCLHKHQNLFAGIIPDDFRRHCEERSIHCHDFMKDEPLTLFNAIATAEGAILEALAHKETLLHQSNCLVLGFGRCGSLIAERLKGLNATVAISVNRPAQMALAETKGFSTFPLSALSKEVQRFDYIFNTIPACYLGAESLPKVRRDCLIIDVASGRKGIDYEKARELSLSCLFCPGLPGKYAAESCAQRMVKFVLNTLSRP